MDGNLTGPHLLCQPYFASAFRQMFCAEARCLYPPDSREEPWGGELSSVFTHHKLVYLHTLG